MGICDLFRMRSTRSTLCCLAGDFLFPSSGVSRRAGCPRFWRLPNPTFAPFRVALALDLGGVFCGVCGWSKPATILLAASAIEIGFALHLGERPHGLAKVQGIHPSFPSFIRIGDNERVGCLCGSTWRHLGRIASCADRRLRSDHGVCYRSPHLAAFCRCAAHLQQAPHVS